MGSDIWGLMANTAMNTATARVAGTAASSAASSSNSSDSPHTVGGLGPEVFLQLLLSQMQNQDPMNPTDGQEFFNQLSQLSLLEQMWQMNDSLKSMTQQQQLMQGSAMIGKTVEWLDADYATQTGVVTGVQVKDGTVSLNVGEQQLTIDQITAVHD
jgi:flagellar basal-body rod modification protein FlgD